jgi:HK97 family phage prohead protease
MSARSVPATSYTRDFPFEVKAVKDDGTIEGLAAVYGNEDLTGDVIEPGAFTKTLRDKGGVVPVLWQHDSRNPIGKGSLEDSRDGLLIKAKLLLSSQQGREAYEFAKNGIVTGFSIGYDTVVSEYDSGRSVRHLKELRLWEVSLVTFPANPEAQVTAVKTAEMQGALAAILRFTKSLQEIRNGR